MSDRATRDAAAAWRTQLPWRPMSTTSHVFYQLGRLVNANSACVLVLAGHLDEERLRNAAAQLAQRHPLLRSLISRRRGRLGWLLLPPPAPSDIVLRWQQVDEQPLPQLLEHLVPHAWRVVLPLQWHAPFALNVFETPSHTVLQIVTSHIAEDARASYEISHDLAQFYGMPEAANSSRPHAAGIDSSADGVVSRVVHPPRADMDAHLQSQMGALRAVERLQAWWRALRDMLVRDTVLPLAAQPDGHMRGFAMDEVSVAFFDALRQSAKQQGVSVHALLLLALCCVISASAQRTAPRHIRLLDMFSLRAYAGPRAAALYENLVLPYTLRIRRGDERSMLAQINRQIDAMKAGSIRVEWARYATGSRILGRIGSLPLVRALVRRMTQATVLVTNPGRIPFALPHFGELAVREFFTHAQLFPPGAVMCQFSGFRERLRLLFVYDTAAFAASGTDFDTAFRRPFLQALQRLAGGVALHSTSSSTAPHEQISSIA